MLSPQLIGMRLGVYEVQSLLGSGGMASVYRGFDHNLQRPVAIKVLSAQTAAQPGFAERFRQEARVIARLRHPNIVHVYDFGEQGGITYMVQELLPGPTLEQRLIELSQRNESMPRDAILAITAQLASALDAAHTAGIIHRDVKPANALWNVHGELVLTDFGIAKNTVDGTNQTQAGMVVGTPDYLSPEQAQGLPLTPASDVYSLGVLLYELISGKPPFQSPTPMGIVIQHIQTPPPALQPLRLDLPAAVEDVVQRALAKDPAARYAPAGELARSLEQAWLVPVPAGVNSAPSLYNQPTAIWQPPHVATPAAVPLPRSVPSPAPIAQPRPQARGGANGSPLRLVILGGLLVLLLGAGAWLAGRSNGTDNTAAPTPTSVPAAAAPTAANVPAESAAVVGTTSAPVVGATAESAVAPTTSPTGPLEELRVLLIQAGSDGRFQGDGTALIVTLDEAQQALDAGDTATATTRLSDMQKQLLAGAQLQTVDPMFLQQALRVIDTVASTYQLTLPFSVSGQ